jgi:hypothetical protein
MTPVSMGIDVQQAAGCFPELNKSFTGGPGGRFFKRAPLAAGGTFIQKRSDLRPMQVSDHPARLLAGRI